MTPTNFPQANKVFKAPPDLEESQCMPLPAYVGIVRGGSLDGALQVVVAWMPTAEEIEALRRGEPIFLSMMGGLAPHYLTTNFHAATHPA